MANKLDENRNNPKKLWQQLKNLDYNSKGKQSSNDVLDINGETCFDSKKVANCFNNFLTSIASTLVEKLPPSLILFDTRSETFQEFYRNHNVQDGFVLASVEEDFIFKEFCKLNSSKGTVSDIFPARFVKDASAVLTKPITYIVNLSIRSGSVPGTLKDARVVPLFKKNKKSNTSNYRPFSVFSVVSKLLEKSVYVQLEGYLLKKNLFYEFQSGFGVDFQLILV